MKAETVHGRKVRILCTDRQNGLPVVALVENDGKSEQMVIEYNANGTHPFNPLLNLKRETRILEVG